MSDLQFSGTVLLVDDQPLVRLVTADLLLEANFHVIEAGNADEALRLLTAEPDVDVMVSDVEMPPGINGYALAAQVHRSWPSVEILMMSGREWPREGDLPPGAAFLPKPFADASLLSLVHDAVERSRVARTLPRLEGVLGVACDGTGAVPRTV